MPSVPHWLPNAISSVRIALVPLWVALAELANRATDPAAMASWRAWATATLVAIGVSDVVDGHLARRFQLQSRLGATLDAVADKLAQVMVLTYLALRPGPAFALVPLWFLSVLIARDAVMLVAFLALRARLGAVQVVHHVHGKLTSLLLFALLFVYSAGYAGWDLTPVLVPLSVWALVSTGLYLRDGWRQLQRRQRFRK